MKGIAILTFDENSKPNIVTQFPINLTEFLKLKSDSLQKLSKAHLQKKMEPNFIKLKLENGLSVVSFYTGFSFRHYVGKPNFAISIFISENDAIHEDIEGMMRKMAHELLPKREALNFDDLLEKYYEMLKKEEILPYWEEIIEGETSVIKVKEKEEEKKKVEELEEMEEKKIEDTGPDFSQNILELKSKNAELQNLLDEKKSKIRELTRKYTELDSENTKKSEEIQSCKEEISEQYIKLESWSQQMADLNQNNAKLMDDIKILNQKIDERDEFLKEKERKIESLSKKLKAIEEVEKESGKLLQEKEDLKEINLGLNSEVEKLEKINRNIKNEIVRLKGQITVHIDSITSLKLEVKNAKAEVSAKETEKNTIKEQIFDLKKEIKILRRERDHYRRIVKEKNLLE